MNHALSPDLYAQFDLHDPAPSKQRQTRTPAGDPSMLPRSAAAYGASVQRDANAEYIAFLQSAIRFLRNSVAALLVAVLLLAYALIMRPSASGSTLAG